MASRIFSLLNPFGPYSILNPRNPFNPFQSIGAMRTPPGGDLDDRHGSVLQKLYGDWGLVSVYGGSEPLHSMPVLCAESWRITIECVGDDKSKSPLTIIANLQLSMLRPMGWVAQASVILCEQDGQVTTAYFAGELDPGDECSFAGAGLMIKGTKHGSALDIRGGVDGSSVRLKVDLGPVTYLGDSGLPRGWRDNNPDGFIPYWASHRMRRGHANGSVTLPTGKTYKPEPGKTSAHFEHQSFHGKPSPGSGLSLPALAEAAITRPQCLQYQARLNLHGASKPSLNLLAYEVRNGNSGTILKRAAMLYDDDGFVAQIDTDTLKIKRPGTAQKGLVATLPDLSFITPDVPKGVQKATWPEKGRRFDLVFEQENTARIRYAIDSRLRYDVDTAHGRLMQIEPRLSLGSATREILDMLRSWTFEV